MCPYVVKQECKCQRQHSQTVHVMEGEQAEAFTVLQSSTLRFCLLLARNSSDYVTMARSAGVVVETPTCVGIPKAAMRVQ